MSDKPLFIPLNTKYYEAFADGSKTVEYRLHGKRWHSGTCWPGRRVTLSKGYGKKNRLSGVVNSVWTEKRSVFDPQVQKVIGEIYGEGNHEMICIKIDIDRRDDFYSRAPGYIGKNRFA